MHPMWRWRRAEHGAAHRLDWSSITPIFTDLPKLLQNLVNAVLRSSSFFSASLCSAASPSSSPPFSAAAAERGRTAVQGSAPAVPPRQSAGTPGAADVRRADCEEPDRLWCRPPPTLLLLLLFQLLQRLLLPIRQPLDHVDRLAHQLLLDHLQACGGAQSGSTWAGSGGARRGRTCSVKQARVSYTAEAARTIRPSRRHRRAGVPSGTSGGSPSCSCSISRDTLRGMVSESTRPTRKESHLELEESMGHTS